MGKSKNGNAAPHSYNNDSSPHPELIQRNSHQKISRPSRSTNLDGSDAIQNQQRFQQSQRGQNNSGTPGTGSNNTNHRSNNRNGTNSTATHNNTSQNRGMYNGGASTMGNMGMGMGYGMYGGMGMGMGMGMGYPGMMGGGMMMGPMGALYSINYFIAMISQVTAMLGMSAQAAGHLFYAAREGLIKVEQSIRQSETRRWLQAKCRRSPLLRALLVICSMLAASQVVRALRYLAELQLRKSGYLLTAGAGGVAGRGEDKDRLSAGGSSSNSLFNSSANSLVPEAPAGGMF
jgi:hypothetical protein